MKHWYFPLIGLLVAGWTVAHAAGDAEAGKTKAESCAGCHGPNGVSANPAWPKLAGQHAAYIQKQLADFKAGDRADAMMAPQASGMSEQDMADVAAYFASQDNSTGTAADADIAARGERLYRGGNKETGVPACMGCHGPAGNGMAAAGFPALGGQHATYTAKALKDFRSAARGNDYNGMMRDIALRMTDADIANVSEYIAGLR